MTESGKRLIASAKQAGDMVRGITLEGKDHVSSDPNSWSITDGMHVCGRCGQSITGCAVCIGQPICMVRNSGS